MRSRIAILAALLCAAAAVPAGATDTYMSRLPATSPFRCLNCHDNQDPTAATATLNAFGRDFASNGFKWDRTLAQKNSDGDSCLNGFEVGDADGDGRLDAAVSVERRNPGDNDCALQLTPEGWSALKQLFR
jgi:hypothetical protein